MKVICPICDNMIDLPINLEGIEIKCPKCTTSFMPPPSDNRIKSTDSQTTNTNEKRSLHLKPLFWGSVVITSIWAYFIFTQYDFLLEKMFGEKSPHLYASFAVTGLFLLTWLVATLLMYFKVRSVLNAKISFSMLIPAMVLFALISAFSFPSYRFDEVNTWMNIFRASLASVVIISIPLFLLPPMLRVPRGWFRVTLVSAILVSIILIFRIKTGSGYFEHYIGFSDFEDLFDPKNFVDSLIFLVDFFGKCIIRIAIGFSLAFAVSDTVLWTKKGFITEKIENQVEPVEPVE